MLEAKHKDALHSAAETAMAYIYGRMLDQGATLDEIERVPAIEIRQEALEIMEKGNGEAVQFFKADARTRRQKFDALVREYGPEIAERIFMAASPIPDAIDAVIIRHAQDQGFKIIRSLLGGVQHEKAAAPVARPVP